MDNLIEIHFEVCVDCHKHSWCTHHDPKKYLGLFIEMKQCTNVMMIIDFEKNIENLVCTMNTRVSKPGIGSFEITYVKD